MNVNVKSSSLTVLDADNSIATVALGARATKASLKVGTNGIVMAVMSTAVQTLVNV